MALRQQERQGGLGSGDAAPDAEHVQSGLQVRRCRGVVGGNHRQIPGEQGSPERLPIRDGAERRGAFGEGAEVFVVLISQD